LKVAEVVESYLQRLLVSLQNVYGEDYRGVAGAFLRAYEGSTRGLPHTEADIVQGLATVIGLLRGDVPDTLHELNGFIERYRGGYSRVYVVDCLGLPDAYAVWHRSTRAGLVASVKVFINQRATTEAFKEALSGEPGSTLADIARRIGAQRLGELDRMLHGLEHEMSREELTGWLARRMLFAASYVLRVASLAGGNILILSDHGYDIVKQGLKYSVRHTGIPRNQAALSKLALALLLKKIA